MTATAGVPLTILNILLPGFVMSQCSVWYVAKTSELQFLHFTIKSLGIHKYLQDY